MIDLPSLIAYGVIVATIAALLAMAWLGVKLVRERRIVRQMLGLVCIAVAMLGLTGVVAFVAAMHNLAHM